MKKNYYLLLLAFLFLNLFYQNNILAQGEPNIWYFGRYAGLDFNGGAPTVIANGQSNTREGGATISDASGNLLFYTDGVSVWNKNHVVMPNGTGLLGDSSSTQSAIIVQKPNSATIYYIFTSGARANALGANYSEVDLSLNNGLGDVTANKNILLYTPTCEKLTAVRHCNQKDIWVITHDWSTNAFKTYIVTAAGVNIVPVISNVGLIPTGNTASAIGQLKASPNGEKLASAACGSGSGNFGLNRFELFDFDKTTGIISNPIVLTPLAAQLSCTSGAYGVEFSPDGSKLYCSILDPGNIYQYNLCAGSSAAIAASGVLIGTTTSINGCLQLAPDKKIYLAKENVTTLGVINNPNVLGVGCGFVSNGFTLTSGLDQLGLPNFLPIKQPPPPFTFSSICLTATFAPPVINAANCTNMSNTIISVLWNFGDSASGVNDSSTLNNPTHVYPSPGTYAVTLIVNYACGSDTIHQNITLTNLILHTQNVSICKGNSFILPDGTPVSTAGTYKDTITTTAGCDSVITTILTVNLITHTQNVTICYGATYPGPSGPISIPGTYTDTLVTSAGCDSVAIINLSVNPIITHTQNVTICYGATYPGPSGPISIPGTYTDTLVTSAGCDSVAIINLSVNPIITHTQNITICHGISYSGPSGPISIPGTYTDTLVTPGGCDSVAIINLTVSPIITHTQNATICNGQTYSGPTCPLNVAGTYHDTVTTAAGCDSAVTTILNVLPNSASTQSVTVCFKEGHTLPDGTVVYSSGTYIDTVASKNGCDSIITTTLIVNITPTVIVSPETTIELGEQVT